MHRSSVLITLAASVFTVQLAAQSSACVSSASSRGNPVTGRTLSLTHELRDMAPAQAFAAVKSGLESAPTADIPEITFQTIDADRGTLTGQQIPRAAARSVALEVRVVGRPDGSTQVAISNRFPSGMVMLADSRSWAKPYCAVLESLSGVPTAATTGASNPSARPLPTPTSEPFMAETDATARGFPLNVFVRGELSSPAERDIYPLTLTAADTFVFNVAFEAHGPFGLLPDPAVVNIGIRKADTREEVDGSTLMMRGGSAVTKPFLLGPGRHQVLIGYNNEAGPARLPYSMRLSRFRRSVETGAASITPGVPYNGRLEYAGDTDILSFRAEAGQEVRLRAELLDPWAKYHNSPSATVYVTGRDASDHRTAEVTLGHDVLSAPMSNWERVQKTGVHRIMITSWIGDAVISTPYTGRYRVVVEVRD